MMGIVAGGGLNGRGRAQSTDDSSHRLSVRALRTHMAISAQPEWECVWRSGEPRKRGQDKESEKEETGT